MADFFVVGNSKARKEHWTKERCRNILLAPPKPSLHHGSKLPYRDHHIHLSALQESVGSCDKLLIARPNVWGMFGKWNYCVMDFFSTSIKKLPKKRGCNCFQFCRGTLDKEEEEILQLVRRMRHNPWCHCLQNIKLTHLQMESRKPTKKKYFQPQLMH